MRTALESISRAAPAGIPTDVVNTETHPHPHAMHHQGLDRAWSPPNRDSQIL